MASNKAPPRLGRGLAVLLGDTALRPNIERGIAVNAIPIDQIDPNPFQPRTDFDSVELESLAELIRAQGLLQPILIRPHPTAPDRYQIVAGERRFRAAVLAGLTEIPSILREADDSDCRRGGAGREPSAAGSQRHRGSGGISAVAPGFRLDP